MERIIENLQLRVKNETLYYDIVNKLKRWCKKRVYQIILFKVDSDTNEQTYVNRSGTTKRRYNNIVPICNDNVEKRKRRYNNCYYLNLTVIQMKTYAAGVWKNEMKVQRHYTSR